MSDVYVGLRGRASSDRVPGGVQGADCHRRAWGRNVLRDEFDRRCVVVKPAPYPGRKCGSSLLWSRTALHWDRIWARLFLLRENYGNHCRRRSYHCGSNNHHPDSEKHHVSNNHGISTGHYASNNHCGSNNRYHRDD